MRNQIEHCKVKQNSDERLWSEGVREEWRHVEREGGKKWSGWRQDVEGSALRASPPIGRLRHSPHQ